MRQDLSKVFDQVLAAAANGPFFPDCEFGSLMGRTKEEFRAAIGTLPAGAALDPGQRLMLAGAINNLLGYPHGEQAVWSVWVSASPEELSRLLKLLQAQGRPPTIPADE